MLQMANWTNVRLELGRTRDFPHGSPARHYLLRLPLGANNTIDEQVRADRPYLVTVRRFWPQEPDLRGHLVKVSQGWAFSYTLSEQDEEEFCQLPDHPLCLHETVTIAEARDTNLPYRVSDLSAG